MRGVLLVLLLGGCRTLLGFEDTRPITDAAVDPDAGPVFVVTHLPAGPLPAGAPYTTLRRVATIDTSALEIDDGAGVMLFESGQDPAGPAVAVLVVESLHVVAGSTLRVIGSRALIVVASNEIVIDGELDGSALRSVAGPGALTSGSGVGLDGARSAGADAGGAGGGFGTAGGNGGTVTCTPPIPGGLGGAIVGAPTLTVLHGGSRGGSGSPGLCSPGSGGGGGGAIQLSALQRVSISGRVHAGGGGGDAGAFCGAGDTGGGYGGGSGGAIFIEAPTVTIEGLLAANGGGGGSGTTGSSPGAAGGDAVVGTGGAGGGMGAGEDGGAGGASIDPSPGVDGACGVAQTPGGGGGAVGRIVVRAATFEGLGTSSPAVVTIPI